MAILLLTFCNLLISFNNCSFRLFSSLNSTGILVSRLIADTRFNPNILFACSMISGLDLYVLLSSI